MDRRHRARGTGGDRMTELDKDLLDELPEHEAQYLKQITGEWDYSTSTNVHLGQDCFIETRAAFDLFASEQEPGLELGEGLVCIPAGGVVALPF